MKAEAQAAWEYLKQEFEKPGGPQEWLTMARTELEKHLVASIESEDTKNEKVFRGLLDVHDLTVVATRCVLVYELTKDLAERSQRGEDTLAASRWLAGWLRANTPKTRDQVAEARRRSERGSL